jgi:hypothetical protein
MLVFEWHKGLLESREEAENEEHLGHPSTTENRRKLIKSVKLFRKVDVGNTQIIAEMVNMDKETDKSCMTDRTSGRSVQE